MNSIQHISVIGDLAKLPRETLEDLCTNLDLPSDGSVLDLVDRIWTRVQGDSDLIASGLAGARDRLLCGRTSITWHQVAGTNTLKGMKNKIIASTGFNPFERSQYPNKGELTTLPVLVSAAQGTGEGNYYLRFISKAGMSRHFYGAEMEVRPRTALSTVYVDEDSGCIEVRVEPKLGNKVAAALGRLLGQETNMTPRPVMAPFGNNVEAIADALGGELVDASSKPELLLEDFTGDQAKAIVKVLQALDGYFVGQDLTLLGTNLSEAVNAVGEKYLRVPFTALILSGLQKVGMGVSGRDLRGSPLYDYLKPYLQHQGGFIQFQVPEGGLVKDYTIRIGLENNTVFFNTPATETSIAYVRERLAGCRIIGGE